MHRATPEEVRPQDTGTDLLSRLHAAERAARTANDLELILQLVHRWMREVQRGHAGHVPDNCAACAAERELLKLLSPLGA